jgi:hypothetical protein
MISTSGDKMVASGGEAAPVREGSKFAEMKAGPNVVRTETRMQILPAYMMRNHSTRGATNARDLSRDGVHMHHELRARYGSPHNLTLCCQTVWLRF